ncbi:hypothetical protein BGZ90_003085 [Linnemannia elongata]|nr:hypothetical protein BGZ90_003085 [Linnemannia elongata]
MSCYICRHCARGPPRIPARIPALSSSSRPSSSIPPPALAKNRSLSTQVATTPPPVASTARSNTSPSRTLAASKSEWHASTTTSAQKPIPVSTTASRKPSTEGDKHAAGSTATSVSHIRNAQRRIDQLALNLEVDALYIQFWRICQTATVEEQRQIWSGNYDRDPTSSSTASTNSNSIGNGPRSAKNRQESLYRAFNSSAKPKSLSPPRGQQDTLRIPYGKPSTISKPSTKSSAASATTRPTTSTFTMHFLGQSHAKRLLQMHQYFEQVLGIPIGYNARIALLVAFSSRGDMITTLNLFRQWQRPSSIRGAYTDRGGVGGGKEMYSVVIRGLVGRNFQDSERRSFYVQDDPTSGIRNQGVTQVYTALELFYDLLRQGGTPSFETYHSLIVGLSTFKNDMEAAELLLDHMIVKKKRPYVQVLHVMCREYARRKDFVAVERIFGMLKEYGIRPRAVTCNVMLRAIFQMSTLEALQYLGHTATTTFSILCYGFGHMRSGFPDLQEVMVEMVQGPSAMKPNLVVLNSLLFAHLNHGKIRKAESILDQILLSFHPFEDFLYAQTPRRRQQSESPFRKHASTSTITTGMLKEEPNLSDHNLPRIPMVPGKGAFHALMLAYVEQGDISSMERIVDKMIQTQHQQRDQHYQRRQLAARLSKSSKGRSWSSSPTLRHLKVDLEADEYTATIMLLGYLTQRDLVKADLIQQQIRAHPDWRSSSLFLDRDENRQELIDFVRHQSSKEIARRSLLQSATEEDDGDFVESGQRSVIEDIKAATGVGTATVTTTTTTKPLSGDLQGELDDDIEIDVTTLSAKLRGLMNSTSPTTSSSSSSSSSPSSS